MHFQSTHVLLLLILLSYYIMENLLLNQVYKFLCTLHWLQVM